MKQAEQIETNRMILKILDETATEKLVRFLTKNRALFEHYEPERSGIFYTEEYQRMVLKSEYEAAKKKTFLRYYFFEKGCEEIIGTVSFSNLMHFPYAQGSVGYKVDKDRQGEGFATEAMLATCGRACEYLGIHRLEANVLEENKASVRVLEKSGFVYEGTRRKNLCVAGAWQDHMLYGKLFLSGKEQA